MLARDFTGDAITDLLLAFHDNGGLVVEKGDGHGNFCPLAVNPRCDNGIGRRSGGYNISSGDVDGDGLIDIVVSCQGKYVVVAKNLGNGRFERTAMFTTEREAKGVKLSNLDADSHLDLLYTSRSAVADASMAGGKLYLTRGLVLLCHFAPITKHLASDLI